MDPLSNLSVMPSWRELVAASLDTFLHPESRLYWPYLAVLPLLILLGARLLPGRMPRLRLRQLLPKQLWRHPSARVDLQLWMLGVGVRCLLAPLFSAAGVGMAVLLAKNLARTLPALRLTHVSVETASLLYALSYFLLDDLSRYLLHRAMHRTPWLWGLHRAHHSAPFLNPLTFHRLHPLEVVLLGLRHSLVLALVGGCFLALLRGQAGLETPLLALVLWGVFNATSANLRHSHVYFGFGRKLEHLLISPAQHQLHHSRAHSLQNSNYGSMLAVWDWLAGTLSVSSGQAQPRFGLYQSELPRAASLKAALLPPRE